MISFLRIFLFLQRFPEYYLIPYFSILNVVYDAVSIQILWNAVPTNQLCSHPFFGFRKINNAVTGYLRLLFMYIEILENIQSSIHNIIGRNLASQILSLSLGQGLTSLFYSYDYFHGDFSNEVYNLRRRLNEFKLPFHRKIYFNSFCYWLPRLWNYVQASCFIVGYDPWKLNHCDS